QPSLLGPVANYKLLPIGLNQIMNFTASVLQEIGRFLCEFFAQTVMSGFRTNAVNKPIWDLRNPVGPCLQMCMAANVLQENLLITACNRLASYAQAINKLVQSFFAIRVPSAKQRLVMVEN